MSATDLAITLALLVKLEAPGGDVNLTAGGVVKFDAGAGEETYASQHATFGTLAEPDEFEAAFGDMAESGTLRLIPNPAAALGDWYSNDLLNARVRVWLAEVDASGVAVDAAQIADQLVDTLSRVIGADGSLTLELGLIGRAEKLFLINQGNVCSERFHKSVWAGEDGFNNCTDVPQPVAWGIAAPPSGTTGSGGAGGSGFGGGGFGSGDLGAFEVAR